MKTLKVISILSLLLVVLFITLYIVGSKEQAATIESVEPLTTLQDNQSYVTYSHSNEYGHWFIDNSISDDAMLFVDDDTMQGLEQSEKYIATYVDASKWELVALESVK